MLHNCPGEITGQAKGVSTKQVTEAADSLGQREGQCEEITSWVVDMVPPFDQQHSKVTTEEGSSTGLAAVPQIWQVFEKGLIAKEDQHAGFGTNQPTSQCSQGHAEDCLGCAMLSPDLIVGNDATNDEGAEEHERIGRDGKGSQM